MVSARVHQYWPTALMTPLMMRANRSTLFGHTKPKKGSPNEKKIVRKTI